ARPYTTLFRSTRAIAAPAASAPLAAAARPGRGVGTVRRRLAASAFACRRRRRATGGPCVRAAVPRDRFHRAARAAPVAVPGRRPGCVLARDPRRRTAGAVPAVGRRRQSAPAGRPPRGTGRLPAGLVARRTQDRIRAQRRRRLRAAGGGGQRRRRTRGG